MSEVEAETPEPAPGTEFEEVLDPEDEVEEEDLTEAEEAEEEEPAPFVEPHARTLKRLAEQDS